jgi:diguanylate cyclase (GGDEF)-like protein/PAS domain S-box-containing protein
VCKPSALEGAPSRAEADRLASLRRLAILDTEPELAFDEIAQLAARACGAPVALVSFVDEHRQWFKAEFGLGMRETPIESSFCAHAIRQAGLFVVADATADGRFRRNPLVTGPDHIRFYAGARLDDADGLPLGMLCVLDRVPRPAGLDGSQGEVLSALARSISRELRLRDATRQLAERETALARAEQRYRALIEASGIVVWRTDAAGNVMETTAAQEPLGARAGSRLGRGWLDYVHPDDRPAAMASWENAPKPFERVERRLAPDGGYRWAQVRAIPLRDDSGAVREWVGAVTDIDDQKRAADNLRQSEARYRALVQASAAVCWRAAPDGVVTDIFGWGELAGKDLGAALKSGQWLDAVHPDDRPRATASWQQAIATGQRLSCEHRIFFDGAYRWVHASAVALRSEDGSVHEWVGTVANVDERVVAKKALQETEERYRLASRATADAVWDWDLANDQLSWGNPDALFGYSDEQIESCITWWSDRIHPDDCRRVTEKIFAFIKDGNGRWSDEYRFQRPDGSYADILDRGFLLRDESGAAVRMVGAMQDISYRKVAEEALRSSETHLHKLLQALPAAVFTTDADGHLTYFNDAAVALWGLEPTLGGSRWTGAWKLYTADGTPLPHDQCPMATAIRERRAVRGGEAVAERPDGTRVPFVAFPTPLYDSAGRLTGAINMLVDVTAQKAAEQRMWRAANQDPLTGLTNRALFQQRLDEALSRARQDGTSVSLLLIDLDEFKDVNDTLGHDAGDALLQETAVRLQSVMRDCDTVARIGGDEFAVIATAPFTLERARRLAQELVERLGKPFVYDDCSLSSRASIGVASYPDHHQEPRDLMKAADIALYRAKALGRNQAAVYSRDLRQQKEFRVSIVRQLRQALAADEIIPFYQPKVCLRTGRIIGLEALARWRHPTKGVVTPGYFGSAFEDAEIAAGIGRHMVQQAARDMRDWLDRGIEFGSVAVNLSSAEFADRALVDRLLELLAASEVPPTNFEVEVTETVLLGKSADHVTVMLTRLHRSGVRVALDDFGTGFASLTHLKQFPVDHIKIDQSFIRDLEADPDDHAIVAAVIGLGRSLDLQVTAEGVETQGQAQRLQAMGCSSGQGYFYAKPLAGSRIPWLFKTWGAERPAGSLGKSRVARRKAGR